MIKLSSSVLNKLKKPLGEMFQNAGELSTKIKGKRLICIGDICTINLIKIGIIPHLAVFDFKSQRKELEQTLKDILKKNYQDPEKYENIPGTISEELLKDAELLLQKGGGILISGEEDLCALAFILSAKENDLILYGQPNEGIVLIKSTKELKRKIENWILSSRTFSHKMQ